MADHYMQFQDAILSGLGHAPAEVIGDGKLRRFSANGKARDNAGWYVFHDDGVPAGKFGDWRTGHEESWCSKRDNDLNDDEREANRQRYAEARRAAALEREAEQAAAANKARDDFAKTLPAGEHPYLTRKGVQAHGIRQNGNVLLIPVHGADGEIQTLQTVNEAGEKRFTRGGKKAGGMYCIGDLASADRIVIVEGFATGASVHEASGLAVAVAFDAGNLLPVAQALRAKYPRAQLVFAADDDHLNPENPGLTKASAAARAVAGLLAVPGFGPDRGDKDTDFNDLAQRFGLPAVRACIEEAKPVAPSESEQAGASVSEVRVDDWADPQPFEAKVERFAYPLEALPPIIHGAVTEVHAYAKAPPALIAACALSAISVALQGLIDVRRDSRLQGPVSLFMLTIADSGERKSTCDGYFSKTIRDFEAEQREALKPDIARYKAAYSAWESEREGLLAKIKKAAAADHVPEQMRRDVEDHQAHEPEAPRVPRIILGDETPEALASTLAKNWPSAGILNSEGGVVLGAHGMSRESVMRNLALQNTLWDGGTLPIGRKTSECIVVKGARLTIGLQVQEATLRQYIENTGDLARGTGNFARFLIAWPESTQGTRQFAEGPAHWPKLAIFNRRMESILNEPLPLQDDGTLAPALVDLTPEAKALWISFHNEVEAQLGEGGDLRDVRDVASKVADNACRLAGLFQSFEAQTGSPISAENLERASTIALWHLNESRRFFGEIALGPELSAAARLDTWLIARCQSQGVNMIPVRTVQQFGPGSLRERKDIESAVKELAEMDRARFTKQGRTKCIEVNGALL